MNKVLLSGAIIVNFALLAYTFGVIAEQRKKVISSFVLNFLTIGIIIDITATSLMIAGSKNSAFTLHAFIGYSALVAMLIAVIFVWKLKIQNGYNSLVPSKINLFIRFAYLWWLLAYILGILIVVLKEHK